MKTRPIRRLGRGGQGIVWLVEHLGQKEAHKILTRPGVRETDLFREAIHTRKVDSPNIVDVYGTEVLHPSVTRLFGIDAEEECPTLRMEYVEGRDLARYVDEEGVLPTERLIPIGVQIAAALQLTHESGIVHHDLKPSNVILRTDGQTAVVTDFGISAALRQRDGKLEAGRGGTPYFMAPELFESEGRGTPQSDVWSLGVTLYFLATREFPFPFDELPTQDAVRTAPRNPCEKHWHVEMGFWRILKRMLRHGAEPPYATMAEAAKDLRIYADSIECPACGQTFRYDSVSGRCPNPGCQKPGIVAVKEGALLERSGETAIAECRFGEAREAFQRAGREYEAAGARARVERCGAVLAALPGLEKEHEGAVVAVREHMEKGRYVEAIRRLAGARVHFSRSADLKAMRSAARDHVLGTYERAEGTVRERLRGRAFKEAREVLTRVDQYLAEEHTRREIEAGLDDEPRDLRWLYKEVEEKELRYERQSERARRGILAFDFDTALRAYSRIENEFPAEENGRMIARLRRAVSALAAAERYSAEQLESAIADPRTAADLGELAFDEGRRACEQLVQDFPPADHPPYQRFQEQGSRYAQACEALVGTVAQDLERAKARMAAKGAVEALTILGRIKPLVLRSDLFELQEREAFVRDLRQAEADSARTDELYDEGKAAFEARDYATAHLLFKELADLVSEGHRDVDALLEESGRLRDRFLALSDEVAREFAQVEEGRFTPESALLALDRAEQLFEVADDSVRRRLVSSLAEAVHRLFESQREYVRTTAGMTPLKTLAFLTGSPILIARKLPIERWEAMFGTSPELRRSLLELLAEGLPSEGDAEEPAERFSWAREYTDVLGQLGEVSRLCDPPPGASHPAVTVAGLAVNAVAAARRALAEELLPQAETLIGDLAAVSPDSEAPELRRLRERLRQLGRRTSIQTFAYRFRTAIAVVVPLLLIGAGAFAFAEYRGRAMGRAILRDRFGELASGVSDDDSVREKIQEALEEEAGFHPEFVRAGGGGPDLAGLTAFLADWRGLREARDKGDGSAAWRHALRILPQAKNLVARVPSGETELNELLDYAVQEKVTGVLRRGVDLARRTPESAGLAVENAILDLRTIADVTESALPERNQALGALVHYLERKAWTPAPQAIPKELGGEARKLQILRGRARVTRDLVHRSWRVTGDGQWAEYWEAVDQHFATLEDLRRALAETDPGFDLAGGREVEDGIVSRVQEVADSLMAPPREARR